MTNALRQLVNDNGQAMRWGVGPFRSPSRALADTQRRLGQLRQRLEAGPKVPRMGAVRGRPMGRTEGESSSERLEHLNGSQTVATNEHSSDGCNTEFIQIYMYATMQRN